jgi:hypothetical protein
LWCKCWKPIRRELRHIKAHAAHMGHVRRLGDAIIERRFRFSPQGDGEFPPRARSDRPRLSFGLNADADRLCLPSSKKISRTFYRNFGGTRGFLGGAEVFFI